MKKSSTIAILGVLSFFAFGLTSAKGATLTTKPVESWQDGAWTIQCSDYGTKQIVCDLNTTVKYGSQSTGHMFIPHIYVVDYDGEDAEYRVRWEYDPGIKLSSSQLNSIPQRGNGPAYTGLPSGGGAPQTNYRFYNCGQPCRLDHRHSDKVMNLFVNASSIHWDFEDSQEGLIKAPIDLQGFAEGLKKLPLLQGKYGFNNVESIAAAE